MAKIILLVALAFSITTGSITMLVLNRSPRWLALATTGARPSVTPGRLPLGAIRQSASRFRSACFQEIQTLDLRSGG